MRIHRAALVAVCCALPLLAGTAIGCGSPNDSCSGPYRALYAYCAGDGGEEASEAATPVDGGLDVLSEGSAPTEGGEAGCVAPTSLLCGTTCENPTLPANCGSCGHVCEAGTGGTATCTAGQCGVGCSGSTPDNCNGACVDETTDPNNCGTCSHMCPGPTNAGSGLAACSPGADGGPACGLACTAPTSQACGGACANPTDPTTCGSSCLACPQATAGTGTPVCTLGGDGGGACSVTCTGTTTEACPGGACYAPLDPNHCGSCTNACPGPPSGNGQATCASPSTCGVSCTTSYHVCVADCLANTDEPSDTADPCILTETFGVFVAPTGSDAAGTAGSRIAPYATIGHAMDQAKTAGLARVYACGTAGNYTENLVVGSSRTGITVYGGLNCTTSPSTWTYVATDKATVAPASGYALQVTAATTFEDFAFTSAAATTPGSSSIAVFVNSATGVVLERCSVQAGAGMAGQSQTQPGPYTTSAPGGSPGSSSITSGGTGAGGAAMPNPTCSASVGGAGGSAKSGEAPSLLDGQSGQPGGNNAGTSLACNTPPGDGGGSGSAGGEGSAGTAASSWASFSSTGWTTTAGLAGGTGTVGIGGGGGGAAAAANAIGGAGGGGAGGCGGVGGPAGPGGGSSIAVLAYDSSVNLATCTLSAGSAGSGGNGAAGQAGQTGGGGGSGNTGSCGGGAGGTGGPGGPGGGGAGGVSAGVVWTGTAPTVTAGSQTPGAAGAAGKNGDGTTTAKAGTAGGVVQFQ